MRFLIDACAKSPMALHVCHIDTFCDNYRFSRTLVAMLVGSSSSAGLHCMHGQHQRHDCHACGQPWSVELCMMAHDWGSPCGVNRASVNMSRFYST